MFKFGGDDDEDRHVGAEASGVSSSVLTLPTALPFVAESLLFVAVNDKNCDSTNDGTAFVTTNWMQGARRVPVCVVAQISRRQNVSGLSFIR